MSNIIQINKECNQRCRFCSAAGCDIHTTSASIDRILKETEGLLVISGGEPVLNAVLVDEVIRKAGNLGIPCELQSNGVIFSDPRYVRKYVRPEIDLFNINFPAHTGELSDQITQTKGFHPLRIQGVKNLLMCGAKVRLTHIINIYNYKYLADFVRFVKKDLGDINYIQFSFVKIMGLARIDETIVPRYEIVAPFLVSALRECRKMDIEFLADHIPLCWLGEFSANAVDYKKTLNGGDLRYAQAEKIQVPACSGCRSKDTCFGPRRDYIELFGEHGAVKPIN